jgi:hypothetical protein
MGQSRNGIFLNAIVNAVLKRKKTADINKLKPQP